MRKKPCVNCRIGINWGVLCEDCTRAVLASLAAALAARFVEFLLG